MRQRTALIIVTAVFVASGSAYGEAQPRATTKGVKQGNPPTRLWKAFPLRAKSTPPVAPQQPASLPAPLLRPERPDANDYALWLWIVVGSAAVGATALARVAPVSQSLGIERSEAVWFGLTVAASIAIGWFIGHLG